MTDETRAVSDNHDYQRTITDMLNAFRSFAIVGAVVSEAEAAAARRAITSAEEVGCFVDPTQYRAALSNGSLDRQKAIVDLFIEIRRKLPSIFPADPVLHLIAEVDIAPVVSDAERAR